MYITFTYTCLYALTYRLYILYYKQMVNLINKSSGIKRTTLSMHKRWEVYTKDNFTCKACNNKGCFIYKGITHGTEPILLNIDHIQSLTLGGADVTSNMHTLCAKCNAEKGTLSWIDYLKEYHPNHILLDSLNNVKEILRIPENNDWSSVLYRPLPEDNYDAFVVFSVSIRNTKISDGDLLFYKLPRLLCEDFAKSRSLSMQDLEEYISRDDYIQKCREELRIGMKYESLHHLETLQNNRSNMQAVSFIDTTLKEQNITGGNTIMIQQNVYNNIAERYNLKPVEEIKEIE